MKSLIKGAGKKTLATALFALTNVAVFAAGSNAAQTSSMSGMAAVGFFAILVGAIVLPAMGHKAHH
jgi:hypothetical protein